MFEVNNQTGNQLEVLTPLSPSQNPPEPRREQPRQGRGGVRTAAIIGLILLLIVLLVPMWYYLVSTKRSMEVGRGIGGPDDGSTTSSD